MEILSIEYSGYLIIDKNDMVIEKINPETGEMVAVDVEGINTDELLSAISKGTYYLNLDKCRLLALDGDEHVDVYLEDKIN